jgi:predicted MFS family arabinose efflux permease
VLQKTYAVSKSAIVPSVVRSERDLVEANAKLGLISGIVGFAAVIPATLIAITPAGSAGALVYSSLLFAAAAVAATFLSADVIAPSAADQAERIQLSSPSVLNGSIVMMLLRGGVGFVMFLIAFVLKQNDSSTAWFGAALAAAAIGVAIGNATAPRIRRHAGEEAMLVGALVLATSAAVIAATVGGTGVLIVLALTINLAAAVARLGFESMVQRDAPAANRGRAFAGFETRFQLSWALAAVFPVLIAISGRVGALIVAVVCAAGLCYTVLRPLLAAKSDGATPS